MVSGPDLARVEEAALNALQTQRQMFYDGWLLRLSPGAAKRARSVNAHFGSTRPLDEKIAYCERLYGARELPLLFRMTPFSKPHDLEDVLAACGYVAFDPTLVQVAALERPPEVDGADIELSTPPMGDFVEAVGELRGSSRTQRDAHRERLAHTPLATHAVLARIGGRAVGAGQAALDDGLAGIYDIVTAPHVRGNGVATRIVARLLTWAWEHGAAHAYLQVSADNAAGLAVYRKFGFATAYEYHYRARPGECE
jgi:ribosomal protein S18 acetylase RimI-like enzyme